MNILQSKVKLIVFVGLFMAMSCTTASAIYFSNQHGFVKQPIRDATTNAGPFRLQYLGDCECYDASGQPSGQVGALVRDIDNGEVWCTCPEEEGMPWHEWMNLITQCPAGGPVPCAIQVHLDRPSGDPHAHVAGSHSGGTDPIQVPIWP